MLQSLKSNMLFSDTVTIIVLAVTGRTQTEQKREGIADIVVAVRGMEVHGIACSRSSGGAFPPLPDMAKLASPSGLLLTLPGELFPIVGILLSVQSLLKWLSRRNGAQQ